MNVLLSCRVLIETTRIIWLNVNIAIWLYYCWWHRNKPANIMQLLSTQWSCSQVNIQLSYVGVPYRLTSRVICRTICCKHMWAKNWQQNDNRYIAFDPPSVIDYNGIPLCVEYPMAGNLTFINKWFGVWRLYWNHAFIVIDHSILGASCHANTQSSASLWHL